MAEIQEALDTAKAANFLMATLGASRIDGPTPEFTREAVSVGNLVTEIQLVSTKNKALFDSMIEELTEKFEQYASENPEGGEGEQAYRLASSEVMDIVNKYIEAGEH